jgi:DNA-binding NtrC family response regulator
MLDYHWPGNVRELKNAIQFSVVRSRGSQILPSDLPMEIIQDRDLSLRLSDSPRSQQIISAKGKLDIESVKAAIKKTGGNKSKAARVLGVGRATLYRFLAQNEETKNYVDQF